MESYKKIESHNNEKVNRDSLLEMMKQKSLEADKEVKLLFLKWKDDLRLDCGIDNVKFYSEIADLYKEAGLMAEAKDSYYQAAYIAERDVRMEDYEKFMKKFREIDAPSL